MQLHIKVPNCCPQGGGKALPWSLRTLTFALVWNPESHPLIHWLSTLVSSASGHSSYPHSPFLGNPTEKKATGHSSYPHRRSPTYGFSSCPHKVPQQLDTLAIRTSSLSNWTLWLSAQDFVVGTPQNRATGHSSYPHKSSQATGHPSYPHKSLQATEHAQPFPESPLTHIYRISGKTNQMSSLHIPQPGFWISLPLPDREI